MVLRAVSTCQTLLVGYLLFSGRLSRRAVHTGSLPFGSLLLQGFFSVRFLSTFAHLEVPLLVVFSVTLLPEEAPGNWGETSSTNGVLVEVTCWKKIIIFIIIIIIIEGSKSRGEIYNKHHSYSSPAGAESDSNPTAAAPSQTEITDLNNSDHSTTSFFLLIISLLFKKKKQTP